VDTSTPVPALPSRPRVRLRRLLAAASAAADVAAGLTAAAATPAVALDNDLAATPPMGWNSWNTFGCAIDEDLIKSTADHLVSSGLAAKGYRYVNIDDCWQAPQRDPAGRLQADPTRFPSGIKALADHVHAQGLKLGIYSTAGTGTCQRLPGSLGHEDLDARTFASWGVDYLKYDHCFTEKSALPDIDRITLTGGDQTRSYEGEAAQPSGTARTVDCPTCSGGARVSGLGAAKGALDFSVDVPAAGTYRLGIDYLYGADPRTSYYPTGYVTVNGQRAGDRIRFDPSPSAQQTASYRMDVTLAAGGNTIRLDNPLTDLKVKQDNFARMRDALAATGRPIVYSINANTQDGTSFADIANLWRTTQDIKPLWHSTSWYRGVDDIIEQNGRLGSATGPGHWNDPDMLEVGVRLDGFPGLTPDEERTHFSMWAMMAAPLIAGADVRTMSADTAEVLGNSAVIAVDQDRLGQAGTLVASSGDTEVWVRVLHNGDRAVVLRNRGTTTRQVTATPAQLGVTADNRYLVRDLWADTARTHVPAELSAAVPAHGVAMYRIHRLGR
jgi:alpha-galactosidase